MNVEKIAKVCHDANRSYCMSIGDFTQKNWENAPDWQKESVINGVNFYIMNPDSMPEDSHNNWLKQKEAEGWKFGEVKDVEKKEHPCFVPYDQLPEAQKKKDALFIAIVRALVDHGDDFPPLEDLPNEEKADTKEKRFQFLAIIDGSIQRPVFDGADAKEANKKFREKWPKSTIHECKEI